MLRWESPLMLKSEELDAIFKAQVEALGAKFWRENENDSTTFESTDVRLTAFGGRMKISRATVAWKEPRFILLQMLSGDVSSADADWLHSRFDQLLNVPRKEVRFSNGPGGIEWLTKSAKVLAYRTKNEFRVTIIQTSETESSSVTEPLSANLDALLNFSSLWGWSTDDFESNYTPKAAKQEDQKKPPQFEWLSTDKARARFSRQMFSNVETKLSMFAGSIKLEEAVVEFVNGKAARSTISFYNRGDSGDIAVADFERIFKTIGQGLGQVLKVAPKRQLNSANAALPVTGWMWTSPQAIALLEYNEYNTPGRVTKPEFLRLKLAAPSQADFTMGKMVTGVQSMELAKRVTKGPDGDIYITGVPMVDQGAKGYCVAASCQRLFEYMRIPCDQHEMAQLVNVDAESGANVFAMQKSLAKIDERFKVSFKPLVNPTLYYSNNGKRRVSEKEFTSLVKEYANKGIPLLWALELGKAAEIPPLPGSGQTRGGHMRMIIGYNDAKKQVIFTDSWGAGHELKRMALLDAYDVTIGLFSMAPRGL